MQRALPFIIIAAVAVAAVTSGALLYRTKVAELTPVGAAATPSENRSGEKSTEQDLRIRGNPNATVTVEEFADFQCPPCAAFSQFLARAEHEYGGKMRVLFRHFPLQMHNFARDAAAAAEAAALQGRFWEMHDLLYRNQNTWSKANDVIPLLTEYASSIGLDVGRFRDDLSSPQVRERVREDQERGTSRGVKSTPTVFINGHPLPPSSFNEPGLRAAIDAALRGEAPPAPSPTATPPVPVTTLAVSPSPAPQP